MYDVTTAFDMLYTAILYTLPKNFYIAISLVLAVMLESCCTLAVFQYIGLSAMQLTSHYNIVMSFLMHSYKVIRHIA